MNGNERSHNGSSATSLHVPSVDGPAEDHGELDQNSAPRSTPQARRKRGLSLRSQLLNKVLLDHISPSEPVKPQPSMNTLLNQGASSERKTSLNPELAPSIELNDMLEGSSSQNHLNPSLTMDSAPINPPPAKPNPFFDQPTNFSFDELTNDSSTKHAFDQPFTLPFETNQSNSPAASPPQISVHPPTDSHEKTPQYTVMHSNLSRSSSHLSPYSSTKSGAFASKRERAQLRRYGSTNRAVRFILSMKNAMLGIRDLPPTEAGRVIPLSTNHEQVNDYFGDLYYSISRRALVDERTNIPYVNNVVTSSKYTIYTFFPKQLKAQFSKIANCYFMVVAIMQMIPGWSTTGHYTTIIPLLIFMSISIAREGFDDWKRHGHDKEENNKMTRVVREDDNLSTFDTQSISTIMTETMGVRMGGSDDGASSRSSSRAGELPLADSESPLSTEEMRRYNMKEYPTKWKHVKVGDIIKVHENEWFPADVVLLSSSNHDTHEAFVETMALDGETNLKSRTPHKAIAERMGTVLGMKSTRTLVTVEDPNADLYNFEGSFEMDGECHALGPDNVVYRGCVLRNTLSVLGMVVFTGEETKIRMNNLRNPRTKAPKLQRNINFIVMFMVCVVILLSAFSTMGQRLIYENNRQRAWYLGGADAGVAATLMGFIIMYNTLIPLSLYVTMEIIKVMQLLFLQFDIDMYHVETNTPADAKTATILEELGQVSYVFSDKTGTLTDNLMLFKKFSVCGVNWEHKKEDRNDTNSDTEEVTVAPTGGSSEYLLNYIIMHPQTLLAKKASFFLLCIALCTTCLPKKAEYSNDFDREYQAALPDELALVQAARDLGYVVTDRQSGVVTLYRYMDGCDKPPKVERYEILDVVEFSLARKRMSVVVRFPDGRVCLITKGADNVIMEKLKHCEIAHRKARELATITTDRKTMEADVVLRSRFSQEAENRASMSSLLGSLRKSFAQGPIERLNSIDNALTRNDESEIADIANKARQSLHSQQHKRYSFDGLDERPSNDKVTTSIDGALSETGSKDEAEFTLPDDRLMVNDEFLIEKTLEHIEDFSIEGLRTLMYGFRWLEKSEYDEWAQAYLGAKTALVDRSAKIEEVGAQLEHSLEICGATAIEDKLQDGVCEAIQKLRKAGIKMWMLTGDKRETAINIGHSCTLIKDYSTVIVLLNLDEGGELMDRITLATLQIQRGGVAHAVLVIDGATLGDLEKDPTLFLLFLELCVLVDLTICCRASPSQKANMVSAVRAMDKRAVTLAIGDGANDIAMIQSADIGVGITGKEGLQAARSADYAIAQFRFLLKLLLVHGRYNYIRTSKFVLCTFYKELLFYLTQAVYQRNTMFLGSSMYESWSLSMFNTLFTSLPVLCIGMFDQDLKPATLLAVPELYNRGRCYRAFNLPVFVGWMLLATFQSVGISFLAYYAWGFTALKDNTTFPLGTLAFAALTILINAKCELIEMQNRQWLAFAAFIILVGGYAVWNVLIMMLYRLGLGDSEIFFVAYGLETFGPDQSWWAALLALFTVPILFDVLIKVFKFMFFPSDDELFRVFEKDVSLRRLFEERAYKELHQGWTFPRDKSTVLTKLHQLFGGSRHTEDLAEAAATEGAYQRKRAGTNPHQNELPPGSGGEAILGDFERNIDGDYEILPSGKRVKLKERKWVSKLVNRNDEDVDEIIERRLEGL